MNYAMYGVSATKLFSFCYDFHVGGGGTFGDQNVSFTFANSTSGGNGNLYQVVNNLDNNRTQNFSYDSLNRITQAWTTGPNWGETFTIDAWGNLTNKGPVTGKTNYEQLNAAPATVTNRLNGYDYDAAGNTRNDPQGNAITYDAENRVSAVNGYTYLYDGDGERVAKISGSVGTLYWGGSGTDALAESTPDGTLTAEYVFFGGKRIARIDRPSGTVHYYFSDQVNSARLIARVVDSSNVEVDQESDFYPYGGEMVIRGADSNHYKFTGKERDTETGLDNFGARYYASGTGRFMTPDWDVRPVTVPFATFGDPQTLNLYTYVENSPLNRIDPDGHLQTAPYDPMGSDGLTDAEERYLNRVNKTFAEADEAERQKRAQNQQKRDSIAANAEAQVGNTGWRYSDPPAGRDKCNTFVIDTIHKAGADASFKPDDGPARSPLAGEWLNPEAKIANWRTLGKNEKPQPGDVAAEAIQNPHPGATGHVGIVVNVSGHMQITVAASTRGPVYRTSTEFLRGVNVVTYRRYTGD